MNHLSISGLQKTYANGVRAIDNINLELGNGMFGLLGPNGAGKSSLMRTIAGLQNADAGTIHFNGIDVLKFPAEIKKSLGYLPQDFGVYPKISAYKLLQHLAILKGVNQARQRKQQIESILYQTNLFDQRDRAVSTFSGGMRQRFGVAQALLGAPKIIIVDEPTAGLDPEERNRFNNFLSEIGEQVIIILSTHLVEDVRNLCTHMAIINKGTVIAKGNPNDFIDALQGKIWSRQIETDEKEFFLSHYPVLSTHFQAGKLQLTIESESNPGNGFKPKDATLEDVYFSKLSNS